MRYGLLLASALLLAVTAGCNIITATAYYLRPPQIAKPEYEFPPGSRVAVVIEAAPTTSENPVFNEALYERLVETVRAGKSKATFLPLDAVTALRQAHPDFDTWSIQRIGRELGADHVLYLRIDRLVIRQAPDYPVLTPSVELRMKLIGVAQPGVHARLWPDREERDGRLVVCTRPTREAGSPAIADSEARKLGYDTAFHVARPFITVDLEQKPPVER